LASTDPGRWRYASANPNGTHVNVASEPVDEPGLGLGIVVDEVEQRIEHFEVAHRHAAPGTLGVRRWGRH
jgi:hypothetical protein